MSVLRTAAVLDHELNDVLRPHGLTLTQYNVLRILRGAGEQGLCGREVGERLDLPGSRCVAPARADGGSRRRAP